MTADAPRWINVFIALAVVLALFAGLPLFMDWSAADIGR